MQGEEPTTVERRLDRIEERLRRIEHALWMAGDEETQVRRAQINSRLRAGRGEIEATVNSAG